MFEKFLSLFRRRKPQGSAFFARIRLGRCAK